MMKTDLGISLIQYAPIWHNKAANFDKINLILESVPQSTDLVILPEMFNTGFSMSVAKLAENMDGESIIWMREKATKLKKAIVGSLIVTEDGKNYNRAIFAHPDGSMDSYDKRHLFRFGGEDQDFTAGNQRTIIHYLGWRICPLICYDLRFPVWSTNRNDYDLLIYMANWPESRHTAWDVLPLGRAIENQSYVAAVNRIGSDSEDTFYAGGSKIVHFKGNCIAQSEQVVEEIISAVIDFDHLHKYRKKYDFVRDADQFGIFN